MFGVKTCGVVRPYRMTFEKPRSTQDAAGHIDLTDDSNWQFAGKRRVRFMTRGGREHRIGDQTDAEITSVIEMNSDSFTRDIKPSWRGKIGTRRFNFVSVQDVDESRGSVEIEAKEAK